MFSDLGLVIPLSILLALTAELFRKELSLKCKVFSDEANRTLSQVVSQFNSNRMFFVNPEFTMFNALVAQRSLLWGIFERRRKS